MPAVRLIRRWGQKQPGDTVVVDDIQGRWLVDHAIGTVSGYQAPSQDALAPGGDGPDPLVSGDGTRRPSIAVVKGARRGNNALPVEGSPVQYNVGVAPAESSGNGNSDDGESPEPSSKVSGSGRRRKADQAS